MTLIITGVRNSTCTARVLTTLAEKGVTDFTINVPDFATGEHKKPPITDKQPFGVIPILEDGDFTLCESRAICRYIAAKYRDQGTPLVPDPTDIKASAKFEQWASIELTSYENYCGVIIAEKLFASYKGLAVNEAVVDFVTKKLIDKLDVFEKILSKQKYMAGDTFSLIDIFYIPHTDKLFAAGDGHLITDRPHVKAWWEAVSTRESWKTACAP